MMGIFSKLREGGKRRPTKPHEQWVTVNFYYGSTNFQHLYALEDQLRRAVAEAGVGTYDCYEVDDDGGDAAYILFGPDAEALFALIRPLLLPHPFMQEAKVTLQFGPKKRRTAKRVIELNPQS